MTEEEACTDTEELSLEEPFCGLCKLPMDLVEDNTITRFLSLDLETRQVLQRKWVCPGCSMQKEASQDLPETPVADTLNRDTIARLKARNSLLELDMSIMQKKLESSVSAHLYTLNRLDETRETLAARNMAFDALKIQLTECETHIDAGGDT